MSKVADDWFDLPRPAQGIKLYQIRDELREKNLHDTEEPPLESSTAPPAGDAYNVRTSDGTYNDLKCPRMGSAGMRFGRNVPLSEAFPDTANLLTPSPRQVSLELLTRTTFQPATILNVIAAAWIQFMVHDWFVHKKGTWTHTHDIPLADGGRLARTADARAEDAGRSAEGRRLETAAGLHQREHALVGRLARLWQQPVGAGVAPRRARGQGAGQPERTARRGSGHRPGDHRVHRERLGRTQPAARAVRARAQRHLRRAEEAQSALGRRAPVPAGASRQRGAAREDPHGGVVHRHPPEGRPHAPASEPNWYGRFSRLQNLFPKLADNDIFSGIPGSPTDHTGVPFSLTEEFVSVYRMHTLMPDHFTIRSADTGKGLANAELPELSGRRGVEFLARFNPADLFYSFGIHNPGAVRLHNYPKFLQNLVQDNGERFDLGTIDILRDRERGVPRYNRFRRLLHKAPVKSFEELTDNPAWAAEMKRVYNNDLEMVDTMVGLMAEPLPEGMGFSDTAFRIFLLMASRRLKSDRFLSQDYRPEIYTKQGIDWVEENSMKDVISRHFPSVAFAMEGLDDDNAFKPWKVRS